MRVPIRTSLPALWARRLGSLALPVAILPVFMHRERLITTSEFSTIEMVALGLAGLAVLLAIVGLVRLWITGDRGWGRAMAGLFFGLICLAPFAFYGYQAWRFPMLGDASTDFERPLVLVGTQAPAGLAAEARQRFVETYPNAETRNYPIEATEMHQIVGQLVEESGWEVLADTAPTDALGTGGINAIAMTLLGFRDEVALRIEGHAAGSSVAMRSVAFARPYDFGENGHRIEAFLTALDQKVTLLMRNSPVAPAPEADSEAPPVDTEDDGIDDE